MGNSGYAARRQPFLYMAAALTAGILLDRILDPPIWLMLTIGLTAIGLSAGHSAMLLAFRRLRDGQGPAATVALLAGVLAAGTLLSNADRNGIAPTRLKYLFEAGVITADEPVELTGRLALPPEPAPDAQILDLQSETINTGDRIREATGKVRLVLGLATAEARADIERLSLDYGSRFRVLVRLERAKSYRNPGSPDYNEFLETRGYDLKGTVKSPLLIEPLGRASVSRFMAALFRVRTQLLVAIDRTFEPPVSGTLKAMLVGNRYFLDHHVEERLREAGTFHVLVISGIHVAFIALVLFWLTGGRAYASLRVSARAVFLRALASLSLLWAYAVMVGLAPPVTRAAVMLTVGLIGPVVLRKSASINTVALAAFVMLALDPSLISDPAFQLSFVAVAAIAGLALPLTELLRSIGTWRLTPYSPHPPSCPFLLKRFAEMLFWDYRKLGEQVDESPIRYRPDKAEAAVWLCRWRLQILLRAVVLLLITSAAIQLSTLPLMAIYFNRVAPVGVPLNVISGSLSFVIAIGSFAAMALDVVARGLATPFILLVNSAHFILANSIVPFDHISWATFRVAHYQGPAAAIYLLYFAPLAALARAFSRWRPIDRCVTEDKSTRGSFATAGTIVRSASPSPLPAIVIAVSLLAAIALVLLPPTPSPTTGALAVHFLDVGQGDAALIEFPRGSTMLVDAGGELQIGRARDADGRSGARADLDAEATFGDSGFHVGEAVVSRFLWSQGRTHVDYVLATHAHADHMGGLPYVERNFRVGQALVGRVAGAEREFNLLRAASRLTGTPIGVIEAGQQFDIEGVNVQVLWPPPADVYRASSINDDSIVLRLVFGSVAILMAGDIEREAEEQLARSGYEIRADVLKVPHHGSRTSSTEDFLDAVRPRCAVISVGVRSRFGHPHREVVDRYLRRGIRVLQTGREGTVTVSTDGRSLNVRTFGSNPE